MCNGSATNSRQVNSYCFHKNYSCTACCGIFNLDFTDEERLAWLKRNTEDFLKLSLTDKKAIHEYRLQKEACLQPVVIRKDIYVCPFLGMVTSHKAGCMLHPQGSPHPQITLLEHPQNFSFYGESICQGYLCASAENHLVLHSFFSWVEMDLKYPFDFFAPARLLPQSILWRILQSHRNNQKEENTKFDKNEKKIYTLFKKKFEEKNIPISSFENWYVSQEDLEQQSNKILTALCQKENYISNVLDWQKVTNQKSHVFF